MYNGETSGRLAHVQWEKSLNMLALISILAGCSVWDLNALDRILKGHMGTIVEPSELTFLLELFSSAEY
jgi:hypothetical protein